MYNGKKFDNRVNSSLSSRCNISTNEAFIVAVSEKRADKYHALHAIYVYKNGCFERKTPWYCSLSNLVKFNPVHANFKLPLHVITAEEIENGGATNDRNN